MWPFKIVIDCMHQNNISNILRLRWTCRHFVNILQLFFTNGNYHILIQISLNEVHNSPFMNKPGLTSKRRQAITSTWVLYEWCAIGVIYTLMHRVWVTYIGVTQARCISILHQLHTIHTQLTQVLDVQYLWTYCAVIRIMSTRTDTKTADYVFSYVASQHRQYT